MTSPPLEPLRWRLAQLSAHIVVALIALVVIGGATRVMEAGLACPDWPLCYGSLFPGKQMNVRVFLEWFHRLDAFLVSLALAIQLILVLLWRSKLPRWLPFGCSFFALLTVLQGGLGALTVIDLLPSGIVTAHLAIALTLVAGMSGLTQSLLSLESKSAPIWWRFLGAGSLIAVLIQCLFGGRMASTWATRQCLDQLRSCEWLDLHRMTAVLVTFCVLSFVAVSLFAGGWPRRQWPYLVSLLGLVIIQIILGLVALNLDLTQPVLTVAHQLVAALLIALLSALIFRRPEAENLEISLRDKSSTLEPCHG